MQPFINRTAPQLHSFQVYRVQSVVQMLCVNASTFLCDLGFTLFTSSCTILAVSSHCSASTNFFCHDVSHVFQSVLAAETSLCSCLDLLIEVIRRCKQTLEPRCTIWSLKWFLSDLIFCLVNRCIACAFVWMKNCSVKLVLVTAQAFNTNP